MSATEKREVLVENLGHVQLTLVEGKEQGQKLIVEGKIGHCDQPTANGRVYPRHLVEREVRRLQERVNARSLFASVDHPSDGRSRLRDAGAICVGLKVEQNGHVIGKFEIIEGTSAGKDLAGVIRAGGCPGMSSRGIGSTRTTPDGYQTVGEDFKLYTYDFVSDPACGDAYPKVFAESVDPTTVTEPALRAQFPALIESIESRARALAQEVLDEAHAQELQDLKNQLPNELRHVVRKELEEDFSVSLLNALKRQRGEVEEQVRAELLADPSVAGAKKTLEDVATLLRPLLGGSTQLVDDVAVAHQLDQLAGLRNQVDELNQRIKELTEHAATQVAVTEETLNLKLKSLSEARDHAIAKAKGYGYALHVEREIANRPDKEMLREMIGDASAFETIDDLQASIRLAFEMSDKALMESNKATDSRVKVEQHKAESFKKKAEIAEDKSKSALVQVEELATRFERALEESDTKFARAQEKISKLERQLQEASERVQQAELSTYVERRTLGHPKRDEILSAARTGKLASQDQVDNLAESLDVKGIDQGGAHERVRRSLGRGRETLSEDTHNSLSSRGRSAETSAYDERGVLPDTVSMSELKQLAGIGRRKS